MGCWTSQSCFSAFAAAEEKLYDSAEEVEHGYCGHELGVDRVSTIPGLNVPK